MLLRYAQLIPSTEAEGPGQRFAVWVQGCSLNCSGCCNPEMFNPQRGDSIDVEVLARRIIDTEKIEGVSILGGEPFEQPDAVCGLAQAVQAAGLSVMVYSGFTLAELRARALPSIDAALAVTDLLVDGRFVRESPETHRRWIGSTNQVLHFLSNRYSPEDERFSSANTVELRLVNGQVTINGWPAGADAFRRR